MTNRTSHVPGSFPGSAGAPALGTIVPNPASVIPTQRGSTSATARSETQRLADLHQLNILDTDPEQVFDDLVALASKIAGVPTSLVSLIDTDRQWFKAKAGFDARWAGRDVAFCDHVVRTQAELEVPDARLDPRFAENPLVTGHPLIVFYAGFPLLTASGSIPGTLCVIGYQPHQLDEEQKTLLRTLARQVVVQLELRVSNADQAREIELRREAEAELAASRREFQLLAENSTDIVARFEADGTIAYVSPSIEAVLGVPVNEVIGQQSEPVLHPDDQLEFSEAFTIALAGGTRTITVRATHRNGTWLWLEITLSPTVSVSGSPAVLSASRDVTSRKAAEQALADSEANLAAISRVVRRIQSGDDPRETIVVAACEVGQTDSAALIERSGDDDGCLVVSSVATTSGRQLAGTKIPVDQLSATVRVWQSGERLFVPDVEQSPLINPALRAISDARSMLWQPIMAHGVVTAVLAVSWDHPIADLSQRAARAVLLLADEAAVALEHDALMKQYEQLATTDQLTNLPNRRSWDERLAVLLALAERNNDPMVVALADVDHFKAYNDTYGHLDGDGLLQEVGAAIRHELRTVDIVARWGGEEFAIALPGCTTADAVVVLERVRTAIPRGQTISIGIGTWTPGSTADGLIGNADRALYAAKRAGRNRVTVSVPS